ncbi:MAG: hypothetical protein JWO91_2824 [Acidobacteriaceae bacterium]|nr:hypothetical protein [Acidobacteriaceae bacterium]
MKAALDVALPLLAISLAGWLGFASMVNASTADTASDTKTTTQTQGRPSLERQRKNAEQQARPDIEKQRKETEQQAKKNLDQDAIDAIRETEKAINAIAANKNDEALAAIERATGKINILLARNPGTALIPVDAEVDVLDTAPQDSQAILDIAKDASRAVDDKDYPTARILLHSLMSEIHVRTYHLPLATYPTALKDAARLLDQKKNQEASAVLLTALNTLVAVDRVTPIPLLRARDAINEAQAQRQKDKNAAQKSLEIAKHELERARELGYAGKDAEYPSLNDQIANLEKQLNAGGDATSVFAKLREKLDAFVKRASGDDHH